MERPAILNRSMPCTSGATMSNPKCLDRSPYRALAHRRPSSRHKKNLQHEVICSVSHLRDAHQRTPGGHPFLVIRSILFTADSVNYTIRTTDNAVRTTISGEPRLVLPRTR